MKTIILTMPAHWASALMNLDYSGLDKEERSKLNNFLSLNDLSFVDCRGISNPYIGKFNGLLCEVADYTYKI